MKYFILRNETDSRIIGKYPQVEELKVDFQKARGDQFAEINNWDENTELPDFDHFLLKKGAKLTDAINSSFVSIMSGMILSQKAYEIIVNYKLALVESRPAKVYFLGQSHRYCFVWYKAAFDLIDYKNSKFYTYSTTKQAFGNEVAVASAIEFREKNLELLKSGKMEKLYPKIVSVNDNYDFIHLGITGHLSCSENLKNHLETEGITGFRFKEVNYSVVINQ